MNLFRGLMAIAAVALLTTALLADEPKPQPNPQGPIELRLQGPGAIQIQPRVPFPGLEPTLLPPDAVEKLKLTDEQKKKYEKLSTEYMDKQKAAADKFNEAVQSGDAQKIRDALLNGRNDMVKMRDDYLSKVEALLTDEQKKTFQEIKKAPVIRPFPNPRPFGPGQPPVGDVLSKPAQDRLQLTDEQKKKVEALQKEMEKKLGEILTDDQKKVLEEIKKEPPFIRPNPLPVPPPPINPRQPGGADR
jgi:Spy/CpxP family protein refolding chaperone